MLVPAAALVCGCLPVVAGFAEAAPVVGVVGVGAFAFELAACLRPVVGDG